MKFHTLSLKDKIIFNKYINEIGASLSKHNFASLFLDQAFFKVSWAKIKDCICVFAEQKSGTYMLLPPLGEFDREVISRCFDFMDSHNKDNAISRIENASEEQKEILKTLGLGIKNGFHEYLYKREDLIQLRGNKFKPKRAGFNQFVRNYDFKEEKFSKKRSGDCLRLYKIWSSQRKSAHGDRIYQAMLDENFRLHGLALKKSEELGLEGLIIKINSKICAYSLGYKLNDQIFCILFEVADLTKKGIAQYIFKRMCEERKEPFINTMDDSGLEALKKAKLSYRPLKQVQVYRAGRSF